MSTRKAVIMAITMIALFALICFWVRSANGQTTMPSPTTLPANGVGLQPTKSGTTYGLMNWTGGYQGILFSGNVNNVTIHGLKITDPQYGIFQSRGPSASGVQDSLTFYDIDIEMPTRGEHGWRIYGARNQRAYRVRIVNYGKAFTGTTLSVKEAAGMLLVDWYTEGLGPALGPLPLASEKDYTVRDIQFINYNGILTSPLEIGGGCINVSFTSYPGKRCVLKQTNLSKPVLNFAANGHPLAVGTKFDGYDFSGGSGLFSGNPNGASFTGCTYAGKPISGATTRAN